MISPPWWSYIDADTPPSRAVFSNTQSGAAVANDTMIHLGGTYDSGSCHASTLMGMM